MSADAGSQRHDDPTWNRNAEFHLLIQEVTEQARPGMSFGSFDLGTSGDDSKVDDDSEEEDGQPKLTWNTVVPADFLLTKRSEV